MATFTLTPEQALEYIAYAVLYRDLPEDFDGEITCEFTEDGLCEVTAREIVTTEDILN